MGREGGDSTLITSSSIALLQERFRQLQKVRENREKRELLKLLSEAEHTGGGGTTTYGRRSTSSPHHHLHQQDMVVSDHDHQNIITGPDHGYSLSLGLNTTMIPSSTCFWGGDHAAVAAAAATSSRNQADQINTDHVDTSLHL